MTHALALMTGEILADDYAIERVLGSGGFGITYLAREIHLDRQVCIKEYFPADFAARNGIGEAVPRSMGSEDDYDWGLSRFIDEAKALARFDHPNIVRVYRYFQANRTAYMVLQFEDGASLKDWAKGLGRAPRQGEIDAIITPLLGALEVLHDSAFLHRDIAPDNIIIRPDKSPVLIDFGSARGEIARQSRTVSALVKPGYSPYEQYGNDGSQQGPWSDVYALAATLHQLVTGKRPPDAPSRIVNDELQPTAERALGSYRPDFLAAIDWALRLEPSQRPQSIAAWRDQLLRAPPRKAGWFQDRLQSDAGARTVPLPGGGGPLPDELAGASGTAPEADSVPAVDQDRTPQPARPGLLSRLGRPRQKEPSAVGAAPASKDQAKPASESDAPAELNGQSSADSPTRESADKRASPIAALARRLKPGRKADAADAADARAAPGTALVPRRRRDQLPAVRASRLKPKPDAESRRRPARPRRRRAIGWSKLAFRGAAAVVIAALAVIIQRNAPEIVVQGTSITTSSTSAGRSFLQRQFRPHDGGVTHIRYANGDGWLVTTGNDATLKIWNTSWGNLVRTLELDHGKATALAINGRVAVTGHDHGDVAVYDLDDGRRLAHFKRNEARIWSATFVDANTIAAGAHDWTTTLWQIDTPDAPHHVFEGHKSAVQAVALDANRARVASASADKTVRLWDLKRLSHARTLKGHDEFVTAVAFSPDGRRVATGDLGGELRIWSGDRGRRLRRIRSAHEGEVKRLAFLGATGVLASVSADGRLRFWSVRTGRAEQTFGSRGSTAVDMAVASSRKRVAVASSDGLVRIWDASIVMDAER